MGYYVHNDASLSYLFCLLAVFNYSGANKIHHNNNNCGSYKIVSNQTYGLTT